MTQTKSLSNSTSAVYVLTGDAWSRHAAMTWLSIASLRNVHPDMRVELIVDESIARCLESKGRCLAEIATNVYIVPSPYPTGSLRNRDIRTRLRTLVNGPFVYLDGDCILLRGITDYVPGSPVAAVLDFNRAVKLGPPGHDDAISGVLMECGWGLPRRQFNGGVVFAQDTQEAYDFFERWNKTWQSLLGRTVRTDHFSDQLSFDHVADQDLKVIDIAPNEYNVMVVISPHLARDARVLHFFSAPEQMAGTLLDHLLKNFEITGGFDSEAVRHCRQERHPWKPRPEAWQLWRSRNYFRAFARKLCR